MRPPSRQQTRAKDRARPARAVCTRDVEASHGSGEAPSYRPARRRRQLRVERQPHRPIIIGTTQPRPGKRRSPKRGGVSNRLAGRDDFVIFTRDTGCMP